MKKNFTAHTIAPATLQTVLDRVAANDSLSHTRKRDLRSAIIGFAKLKGQPPAAISLELAEIRRTLDDTVPAASNMSPKRLANLRSDLAGAIEASGLRPMLKTAAIRLDKIWTRLLDPAEQRSRHGLSRFARWASLQRISPGAVNESTIEHFIAELERGSLVRNLRDLHRTVARAWNALVALHQVADLQTVSVPTNRIAVQLAWSRLPPSFRQDVERYLTWAAVPDPLAEGARARALSSGTLLLQRTHIQSAVTAAVAAGIPADQITSLASLVEPEIFRALLRHRWQADGRKLSAFTHGVAITLIAIAKEWVEAPSDSIATLKALRSKLGTLRSGLTEKNRTFLRRFDDPRLLAALVRLPDKLWHSARRSLGTRRGSFIDLQTALAIDFLIHVPLRIHNLASLNFEKHLHWPQGRRKPALVTFRHDETKNDAVLEFEIPAALADRLWTYRNEIAPAVIGSRPDHVFVSWTGDPRSPVAIKMTIQKTVLKHLGVKLTPHQFRHLAAKIVLDASPGAYELVRQLLGHRNLKTTTNFYAGIDTRRAGRAHADLVMKLRESNLGRDNRPTSRPREDRRHAGT